MKWKHFQHYWPFVWGTPCSPVNFPHKGQWRRALMFSLICTWMNTWENNPEAGDLRRHHTHYDVIVMPYNLYTDGMAVGWLYESAVSVDHDDIIKWKHFSRYWLIVHGIRRSLVNSPHKGQWRGALVFSLIRAWINGWVNNRDTGDLRCHRDSYDIIGMPYNLDTISELISLTLVALWAIMRFWLQFVL